MSVPWMPKESIACKASKLVTNYQAMVGYTVKPPIPVEDIIERYLEVNLSFEDLEETLGLEDVLGATYIKSRQICINQRLLEDKLEGRLIFTCAHEAGHWVLHRPFIAFSVRSGQPDNAIICRIKNARQPIEWQADYFAASLLMPEKEVKHAFHKACGTEHLVLDNIKSSFGNTAIYIDPCVENWHFIASMVCEAGGFTNVSKQAMIIRLQDLGLLINSTGTHIGWQESCANLIDC
jgi:hypothetical protein